MAAMGPAELPVKGQRISPRLWKIIELKNNANFMRCRTEPDFSGSLENAWEGVYFDVTKILGSVSEIRMVWRCKPEMRSRMIRCVMKQKGRPGVMALAKVLNMNYNQLDEIGGLKGWVRKRNCQRRQRYNRQKRKTCFFSVNPALDSSNNIHINGAGKRGKEGGRQDPGRRLITQSIYS